MKKYFLKLISSKDLSVRYLLWGLKLSFVCASLVLLYYIFLDSTCNLGYAEKILLRECTSYVAASAGLSVSFGLLIDLYIRKNGK
ncbi:MAG: hypothetical protein E7656_02070 [Ruminococcaceae bacterium]|nr:hypothetical protein [Oscillospiraceae bacterium]